MDRLIDSDVVIDPPDKHECGSPAYESKHQEESIADNTVVPEEKGELHKGVHLGPKEVVVKAIGVDVETRRAAAEKRAPPPAVVLHGQLEVRQSDRRE